MKEISNISQAFRTTWTFSKNAVTQNELTIQNEFSRSLNKTHAYASASASLAVLHDESQATRKIWDLLVTVGDV